MKKILDNLINDEIYRMSDLVRYNTREVIKKQNLADHSYYVCLNILNICRQFNISKEIESECLRIGLVHDIGEIYTGDLPYDFKHSSKELEEMFDKAEIEMLEKHLPIYAEIHKKYIEYQKTNKLIFTIVKFADSLDVTYYAKREMRLGNQTQEIKDIYDDSIMRCTSYIEELQSLCKNEVSDDEIERRVLYRRAKYPLYEVNQQESDVEQYVRDLNIQEQMIEDLTVQRELDMEYAKDLVQSDIRLSGVNEDQFEACQKLAEAGCVIEEVEDLSNVLDNQNEQTDKEIFIQLTHEEGNKIYQWLNYQSTSDIEYFINKYNIDIDVDDTDCAVQDLFDQIDSYLSDDDDCIDIKLNRYKAELIKKWLGPQTALDTQELADRNGVSIDAEEVDEVLAKIHNTIFDQLCEK